jgi:hypothetical protein
MDKIIFATVLVLFPFGQLFKIGTINAFDVAVLLLAIFTLFKKPRYPNWYRYFVNFLLFCIFGLVVNSSLFTFHSSLYVLRLWSYSMIAVYVANYFRNHKSLILNLMSLASVAAVFGFIQYFLYPDFRALAEFGWDDHYLRMVGTFFDPAFLGLILVLGAILAFYYKKYLTFLFLVFGVFLTYSRASFLVLFVFFIIDYFKNKNLPKFLILNSLFLILLLVPKNIGEGTTITRTASGINKLQNYKQSFEIIKTSPLYGIGFNNLCKFKNGDVNSHSCSGLDSSILFLFATTGVVGAILLLYVISLMPGSLELKASFVVVLLHGFFTNSLFYPHIMFWLFSLVGLGSKKDLK